MTTLANNILDMARLDTGAIALKREWYPLEEIVGSVLTRLRKRSSRTGRSRCASHADCRS